MRGIRGDLLINRFIKSLVKNTLGCLAFSLSVSISVNASEISIEVLDKIERAIKTEKYDVKFLHKKNSIHPKNLVLLAEDCFNDELSFELGNEIILNSYFNLIGVCSIPCKARKVQSYIKLFAYFVSKFQKLSGTIYPSLSQEAKKLFYLNVWNRKSEDKSLIWLMKEDFIDFESDPSQFNASRFKKIMNKTLRKFLSSKGINDESDIEKIGVSKVMFEIKRSLYESNLEVIRLDELDKVSKHLLDLDAKICSIENNAAILFSIFSSSMVAVVGKTLFPNCMPESALYSLFAVSVLGIPYVLSKVLYLDFDSMIASTSGMLAKRITNVFEFRCYSDLMLVIVNKAFLNGITQLLKNSYDWEEKSLLEVRSYSSSIETDR